jgi:hypothetical protein
MWRSGETWSLSGKASGLSRAGRNSGRHQFNSASFWRLKHVTCFCLGKVLSSRETSRSAFSGPDRVLRPAVLERWRRKSGRRCKSIPYRFKTMDDNGSELTYTPTAKTPQLILAASPTPPLSTAWKTMSPPALMWKAHCAAFRR